MRSIFALLLLGSSVFLCHAQLLMKPPSMRTEFEQIYYVPETALVNFEKVCVANGQNITYTWKFNGLKIQSTKFREVVKGTLRITCANSTCNPFGDYQCFAENSMGVAMSTPFALQGAVLKPFPPSLRPSTMIVSEYEYKVLKCANRPECLPEKKCKVEWKIGAGTAGAVKPNDRIAFSKKGDMHFLSVRKADQVTTYYSCGLWNPIVAFYGKGNQVILNVQDNDGSSFFKTGTAFADDGTGQLGGSVEVQCAFYGNPQPSITWTVDDQVIQPNNDKYLLTNNDRTLTVRNLERADEQTYKCEAAQSHGGSVYTAYSNVKVNVTGKPQPTVNQMKDLVIAVGTQAEFSCKTVSLPGELPPVGPVWYHNGKEITADELSSGERYTADGVVLTILDVQKSYTGTIQCMTFNSEGTFTDGASLVVIDPIDIDLTPPERLEILPGDIAYLAVNATTDPRFQLKYGWTFEKDGKKEKITQLTPSDESEVTFIRSVSADGQVLRLDASSLEGGEIYDLVGTYSVYVHHEYEEIPIHTNVFTDETIVPVPVVTTSAGGFNPIIIAIILGVIVLFIVIFLIIFLLYRNRGGTYPLDKKELAAGHDPEKELADSGFHDLSRADGFDDEKPTNDRMSLNDSEKDYDSDDNFDQEYGDADFDTSKFNEDGSFIGQYADSKRRNVNQSVV